MAKIRPCFARPVEHITETTDFTTGATPCAITSGTYANIISLFRAFATAAGDWVDDIRMSESLKLEFQAGETGTITWDNTTLRDALGFSGASLSVTDGQWYTADYTPLYFWCPENTFSDQRAFWQQTDSQFVGEKSLTGNLSGIALGSVAYSRSMLFTGQPSEIISEEMSTSVQEESRCLSVFFKGAVQSSPTLYNNAPTRGFWYYQDVNAFIADCTASGSEWGDSGGINFGYSSSPDTYVFCEFDPYGLSDWRTAPFFGRSRLRYNVELSFTTAAAGTYL